MIYILYHHAIKLLHQAIRHEKLNQPRRPCEPSPDYNLARCVEEYIVGQAGCQPPWRRFTFDGIPVCDNWTILKNYHDEKWKVIGTGPAVMDTEDVLKTTECSLPCSYMEYKVSFSVSMCCVNVLSCVVSIFLI